MNNSIWKFFLFACTFGGLEFIGARFGVHHAMFLGIAVIVGSLN